MWDILIWLYFFNAILLIIHEIDSAYWKEWELFKIPGGITVFLILHFPLLGVVLYGLILVGHRTLTGAIVSLLLSLSGIAAFFIHFYFIKIGRQEFNIPISLLILISILILSLTQLTITVLLLI